MANYKARAFHTKALSQFDELLWSRTEPEFSWA